MIKKLSHRITFTLAATAVLGGACVAPEADPVVDPIVDPDPDPDPQPDPDPAPAAYSYQTTSNIGDLSTWTIDGAMLHVDWQDIAPLTGDVEKVYSVDAICGSVNGAWGYRTCLVDGNAGCTAGTVACQPGDGPQDGETFTIFEVPGVALIANVEDEELHAGFAAGDCATVPTQDYAYVNLGLGQTDIFGILSTDSVLSNSHMLSFGFTDAPDNQVAYTTNLPGGAVPSITAGDCIDGARSLTVDATDEKLRLVVTQGGHLVLDKPEGQGGLIAFNTMNAATIADFANKQFGGVAFPDDRAPELVQVDTGAVADGRALITRIELSVTGDITPNSPAYINGGTAAPHLVGAFANEGEFQANQLVLAGKYQAGPTGVPGVVEIDAISGDETAIVGVAINAGGKTILLGAVVNELDGFENGVKGNFILVEK